MITKDGTPTLLEIKNSMRFGGVDPERVYDEKSMEAKAIKQILEYKAIVSGHAGTGVPGEIADKFKGHKVAFAVWENINPRLKEFIEVGGEAEVIFFAGAHAQ